MAQTYFPFDSGQGANTTEVQWQKMAQNWLETGVIKGALNELQVYADSSGMLVKVKSGQAWIKGHFYESNAEEFLPIAAADPTNPRTDRIILRLDWSLNTIQLAVVQGVPSIGATVPAITQNTSRWEIDIAQIYIAQGVTSISSAAVSDYRYFTKVSNAMLAQMTKITDDTGGVKINASSTSDDILALLLNAGKGMHTFYNISGAVNNPAINPNASIRGFAHFTASNSGWVFAVDTVNNYYINYCDLGTWKGWNKPNFQNLPLTNGAVVNNNRTPRYVKVGGTVHLSGEIATIADGTVIATLPVGFRIGAGVSGTGQNFTTALANSVTQQSATIGVGTTGAITVLNKTGSSGSAISLSGISFIAEN